MRKAILISVSVIVAVVVFFSGYNAFMLDRSLENLKFSLDVIAEAESVEDVESTKMVLEMLLLDKVSTKKFDSAELAALEYAYSVLEKGAEAETRELTDALISVKHIVRNKIETREIEKGPVVSALDRMNSRMTRAVEALQNLPANLMLKKKKGKEIDKQILEQAVRYEQDWKLADAREAYESLIVDYPDYEKTQFIKLRLMHVCQKLGLYERAEERCAAVIKEDRTTIEGRAAEKLLPRIIEMKKVAAQKEELIDRLSSITTRAESQEAYYKLGTYNIQLLKFSDAREAFTKAVEVDPSSELAAKAFFRLAWCYKFQGRLEDGIATFEELVQKYPNAAIVMDAEYQVADTFLRQGKNTEAITRYKEIVKKHKDDEMAPLSLLQASMIYLYDEGSLTESREGFSELREEYPYLWIAQPGSDYAQELNLEEEKAPKGWLDAILLKGAIGFANVILDTSRPEVMGRKTPYEHKWTQGEMNNIVSTMIHERGLDDIVRKVDVDFKQGEIEVSSTLKLGVMSITCYGKIKAGPSRGGLKYTVKKYRFTFGKTKVPLPVPRAVVNRITKKMNRMLTRREIVLSVEKLELTENELTIKGFRY